MSRLTERASMICCVMTLMAAAASCGGPQKPEVGGTPADTTPPAPDATPSTSKAEPMGSAEPAATPSNEASTAAVAIEPRSGSKLEGRASLAATDSGVKITVDVTGAPPGPHATHIHQVADCSDKDAKNAGDHFNPTMHDHGLPPAEMRHLGDLGNLEVGKDGKGHLEITVAGANLKRGDKMSFLERAIVVHEKVDNGGQPAGNAGKRIGCGEIK
jgi:superoxide dismutase, Cu-Zn family